ncbi:MAG: hypothetical protein ACR2JW_19600 [Thermomicrobiales bacterium]
MIYELYDWDDANLIAAYHNEADALSEVAAQVRAYGRASVLTWTLLMSTSDGTHKENVAEGDALATLALRASAGALSVEMPGTIHTDDR